MGIIAPAIPQSPNKSRYHLAVILLHWVMAVAIILMLATGAVMVNIELDKSWQFKLYQWHKSGGVLLILALAVRIVVRIATAVPPLPARFSRTEQIVAKLGHLGLYLAMITMVLSGWIMVSSNNYGLPTMVFGWFEWPHIPNLKANQTFDKLSRTIHFFGAITLGLLIIGHLGAVIKHCVIDRENLLERMWCRRKSIQVITPLWKVVVITVSIVVFIFVVSGLNEFIPSQSTAPSVLDSSSATASDIVIATDTNHDFIVDTVRSQVTFSGRHMGNPFSGVFDEWEARFHFNPTALDQSHIYASFTTDSATTDDAMYDRTLPENDWFASDIYPKAMFVSETIVANPNVNQKNSYRVTGLLTIRDISELIHFDMHIRELNDASIHLNAAFTIDRLAFLIGAESDPEADWVSREIGINLEIRADRK